ncbi:unnamed protein product [Mycena citricolor]|uniref:SEC7 domain-containing protein n=1 Tax=Mycena citricolor TaxID=2018698 RepID=A0AAD2GYS1_9AGAR|nr:unnamed protein product [Mycena citricolor]
MRKNSRWANGTHFMFTGRDAAGTGSDLGLRVNNAGAVSARRITREAELMLGFEELKRVIRDTEDISALPLPTLLAPFFALLRSPLSTGPITSAALASLHAFFTSGLISPESLELESALVGISSTVSHCKFEASDSSGDEVVLLRIMTVIYDKTLRRSAENTMHAVVRTVFLRLNDLDPETEEEKLRLGDEDAPDSAEIRMTVTTSESLLRKSTPRILFLSLGSPRKSPRRQIYRPQLSPEKQLRTAAIVELLRVLITVLDPSDQQHTDSTRLQASFQLARSDTPAVLGAALRAIGVVFGIEETREKLKLQLELFLSFAIDRLAPSPVSGQTKKGSVVSPRPGTPSVGPSTPLLGPPESAEGESPSPATPSRPTIAPARGETRDLILETLSQIARRKSFMVDLWVNYDCNLDSEGMFERLVSFLTKSVYPVPGPSGLDPRQRNAQYLSLDLLLAFVNDMAVRANGAVDPWPSSYPTSESLIQAKSQKSLVITAASRFNTKPKTGVAFLEENHLIYSDLPADAPASAKTHNLAEETLPLLKAFMGLFDFRGKPIADAMRELLETFRLPGEAQQIARITETFASIYFASEPGEYEIQNEDAVYVLAYSVIMLNTDLHNPQVRKRMTIEDYRRNLRGVNNNSDFSEDSWCVFPEADHHSVIGCQQNIYDSIRKREIIMPEEHSGQLGFDYAWKDLLEDPAPLISAIAYAFISFDDDYVIQRAITGFRQCATLAGQFPLPDVGTNFKGQLAAVVLFNIVNGNGKRCGKAGRRYFIASFRQHVSIRLPAQIFEMFQNLFLHSLLPIRMLQMEDFLGGVSMIPLRGAQPQRAAPRSEGGLLSALSSYLMTPYGGSSDTLVPDATDADIENTLVAIDCITSCRLDELYSQVMQLDAEALVAAVRALEALAHERTVAK